MPKIFRLLTLCLALAGVFLSAPARADDTVLTQDEAAYLLSLYKQLHRAPELSFQEKESAARMASEMRAAGFEVTENIGGYGVVGVLENGDGPTVMVRADMDALPVSEATGLDYASSVTVEDEQGNSVPVMHACGHDMHMTVLVGTVRYLAEHRDTWKGTLIAIAQPAEERGAGARAMLADGLFTRFPRPDYNLAFHVSPDLRAGTIGYIPEFAMANVDSVDITFRGIGGHGAYPHKSKDPVVLAAYFITAVQTLVSREVEPIEAGVVTIGSIHGGTKHNIIGNEVKLQLTVRSYSDETRRTLLDGIARIARGQAISAGLPEELYPVVKFSEFYTPAIYNDPALTERVTTLLSEELGRENIIRIKPVMGGEDFAAYGRVEPRVPSLMLRLGVVGAADHAASISGGKKLPSLHSPAFAPVPAPSIETGVKAMTSALTDLLQ
jgi:hippurate hydrolase